MPKIASPTQTVFVVRHYVNQQRDTSASAQGHGYLNYLTERSEAVQGREEVLAFDRDGNRLSAEEAHQKLDSFEHKYLSFVETLSPHPHDHQPQEWSKADWEEWTHNALSTLEERHPDLDYIAVQHDDPEHPHVQVILASNTTLRREELGMVRQAGDTAAEAIQERQRDLERDPMQDLYRSPSPERQSERGYELEL